MLTNLKLSSIISQQLIIMNKENTTNAAPSPHGGRKVLGSGVGNSLSLNEPRRIVLGNQHPGVPSPGDPTVLAEAGECRAAAKNIGTSDNVGGSGGSFKANDLPSSPSASVMLDSLLAEDELDEEGKRISHSTDSVLVEGRISEGAGDGPTNDSSSLIPSPTLSMENSAAQYAPSGYLAMTSPGADEEVTEDALTSPPESKSPDVKDSKSCSNAGEKESGESSKRSWLSPLPFLRRLLSPSSKKCSGLSAEGDEREDRMSSFSPPTDLVPSLADKGRVTDSTLQSAEGYSPPLEDDDSGSVGGAASLSGLTIASNTGVTSLLSPISATNEEGRAKGYSFSSPLSISSRRDDSSNNTGVVVDGGITEEGRARGNSFSSPLSISSRRDDSSNNTGVVVDGGITEEGRARGNSFSSPLSISSRRDDSSNNTGVVVDGGIANTSAVPREEICHQETEEKNDSGTPVLAESPLAGVAANRPRRATSVPNRFSPSHQETPRGKKGKTAKGNKNTGRKKGLLSPLPDTDRKTANRRWHEIESEIASLRAENASLRTEMEGLKETVASLEDLVA